MRHRINRLSGGGRIVQWSSFTATDGAEVTDIPTDAGTTWDSSLSFGSAVGSRATVDTKRLRARSFSSTTLIWSRRHSKTRNMQVSCDLVRTGVATSSSIGPQARITNLQSLLAQYNPGVAPSGAWQLIRRHPSSAVQIGANVPQALTQDQVYRCKIRTLGPVTHMYIDGVLVLSVEDCYVSRGFAGLRINNATALPSTFVVDNWLVER